MRKLIIFHLSLLILHFSFISGFAQSSFTVFTNAPPSSNEIDTALAGLIDNASTSVYVALYSLERQAIVDALFNAHSRGVTVRIVAETDNYESETYGSYYEYLENAGIPIVTDEAGGGGSGTMHDKFFIFDEEEVWTGSYNPTNNGTVANSNNAILIDDTSLAQSYATEFEEMFTYYYFGSSKSDNTTHSFTIDGYEVESHFSPSDGVNFQIQSEIEAAAHSVYFLIFSFTDTTLGDALISQHNAGLTVRGAFDSSLKNQSGGEYTRLKNAGVPVKVDDYTGALHHKLIIFDPGHTDCAVITGSSNWGYSAFNRNDEDTLIVRHPDIVDQYYDIFQEIYNNHCTDEGGDPVDAITIGEIMSVGDTGEISADDRSNWGESKGEGGSPGEEGEPDTLPPVIIHTPIEQALYNSPIYVHCEIYDPNDPTMYTAKEPTLYYCKTGEFDFQTTSMGALYDKYTGVIPAVEVTTDGVDYYISSRDWAYNLATSPSFSPQSNPYSVEVVEDPDAVIRFTEIMYDPPGVLEDESIYEWVEIFNTSTSATITLDGWQFTDGEGTYAFQSSAEIDPQEYQVLCKTTDGPSGGFTRYVYDPDSVGEITLNNPLGTVTDQLILMNEDGLIVEEVDYSAEWGASNLEGPNEHTLEKIDPLGANDEENWLYSMVEGGTPGAENSPHYIFHSYYTQVGGYETRPGIWINPTLISPGEEECTIYYRLDRDSDVTIKVYNPPGDCSPEHCYDSEYYLVTLVDAAAKTANKDPDLFAPYTAVWDGTYSGQTAIGNCRVVVDAVWNSTTCTSDSNDQMMITSYHTASSSYYNVFTHEPVRIYFYQSKPAYVTVDIDKKIGEQQWVYIRNLVDDVAMPRPPDGEDANLYLWDGRDDDGVFVPPFSQMREDLEADDIYGNVVISRPPLRITGVMLNPRSYFDPSDDIQTIYYTISQDAYITMEIRDETGTVVATPVNWVSQTAGAKNTTWDGTGNTGNGIYTFTIGGEGSDQKVQYSGKIGLYDF